jgi:ABC-type glutathione transport system ATPase component
MALAPKPKPLAASTNPTGGMSPEERRVTVRLPTPIKSECALVIVEHDPGLHPRHPATCSMVLDQGKVLDRGSLEDIQRSEEGPAGLTPRGFRDVRASSRGRRSVLRLRRSHALRDCRRRRPRRVRSASWAGRAGKTTLLRTLAGGSPHRSRGQIRFEGLPHRGHAYGAGGLVGVGKTCPRRTRRFRD